MKMNQKTRHWSEITLYHLWSRPVGLAIWLSLMRSRDTEYSGLAFVPIHRQHLWRLKALSYDAVFACDCSRLHQTRFQSCRVRGAIVSCETNLRQSGGIGANRVKKSRRARGSHDSSRFNMT